MQYQGNLASSNASRHPPSGSLHNDRRPLKVSVGLKDKLVKRRGGSTYGEHAANSSSYQICLDGPQINFNEGVATMEGRKGRPDCQG